MRLPTFPGLKNSTRFPGAADTLYLKLNFIEI